MTSTDTTSPLAQVARRWNLDPGSSVVELTVRALWGLGTLSGRFDRFDGSYAVGAAGAKLELSVDVTSLACAAGGDETLRTAVSRAVVDDPRVRFASTRIVDRGNGTLHVSGVVEAAGETHEVSFPATIRAVDGGIEIESSAAVDHFASSVGNGPLGMLRPPATLHVRARFT